jgi:hypothetical protein
LTIGDYSIELAAASEMQPNWSVTDVDVRQLTSSQVFDSASQSLFQQIAQTTTADYAIINLGSGNKWLSSRLYIFALILGAVSGLKAFVFVENRAGIPKTFVGIATPDDIRVSLAAQYPWFQAAFIRAYAAIAPDPKLGREPYELKHLASVQSWQLSNVVQQYVNELQQNVSPPPEVETEWESFEIPEPTWERTNWLTGEIVEEYLGDIMSDNSYLDSPDVSKEKRVDKILRRKGRFVALIDERGRFKELVDRSSILDKLGSQLAGGD